MTRRGLLVGSAILAALGGCAPAVPPEVAEASHPPIGRFVTVAGLRVHAWDRGTGAPVVLIHGASGNLRDWTFSLAPRIAQTHRVIAFDRPGFGYTDRPADRGWDPAMQARILADAARALGVVRPVVVGHSWGAAVAMAWAVADPRAVAGVVAVSGATMPWSGGVSILRALGIQALAINAYTEYLKASADAGGIDRFIARAFRPQTPPPGYAAYVGGPLALRETTLRANAMDIERLNDGLGAIAPRYPGLPVPVEVLHGDQDPLLRAGQHAVALARSVPQSRLTVLPGVGHMAHHAAPEVLLAAIDRIAGAA